MGVFWAVEGLWAMNAPETWRMVQVMVACAPDFATLCNDSLRQWFLVRKEAPTEDLDGWAAFQADLMSA